MRLLYNLLFPLALLVILPRYLLRMYRRGNFREGFSERFARYTPEQRESFLQHDWFWVHAVSVGELLLALKILRELHRRHPEWRFVVSSTTSTAHAIALAQREAWWTPVYTPLDFLPFVRCALHLVRPRAIILTESEMWPNFVWESAQRKIPILLVNARISPRSEKRYRRFARFLRSVTRCLTAVGLQEKEHVALWSHLGLPSSRLHLTGSVKFDMKVEPHQPRDFRPVLRSHGIEDADLVLLGGSTHEGEEKILADAWKVLRVTHPTLRLLIAPRHVERSGEIFDALTSLGFRVALRSKPPQNSPPDIFLIDTTGELRDWFYYANAVFMGKSLTGIGGQNPVEAIMAGCPVMFGPHMENFSTLRKALLEAKGAIEVRDAVSLADATNTLLTDSSRREALICRAMEALAPHQGATKRTIKMIEKAVIGSDSITASV